MYFRRNESCQSIREMFSKPSKKYSLVWKFSTFREILSKFHQHLLKNRETNEKKSKLQILRNFLLQIVCRKFAIIFEIGAVQKHVNPVDLVKSFQTNIYLQNLASIQKRTSPLKFAHLAEKSGKGSRSNLSTKVYGGLPGSAGSRRWSLTWAAAGALRTWPGSGASALCRRSRRCRFASATALPSPSLTLCFFYIFFSPNFWQALRGPFSAVSTPKFASKY